MFEKELFWDVKLDINGTEIKAHKNVLYARSAFFKNLLEKDDQQDCIKICEDLELFRLLLEYMYVNTIVVQDSSMLVLLYILAKKYGVEEMQEFCRSQLENTLSVENVTYFYEKIVNRGVTDLEDSVIDFICDNYDKLAAENLQKLSKPALLKLIQKQAQKSKET